MGSHVGTCSRPPSHFKRRNPEAASRLGPKKISVARLPVTGSDVFGREEDIDFLDDAWPNQQVNVVTIVAWASRKIDAGQPLAPTNSC